jgi:hypothetical protein
MGFGSLSRRRVFMCSRFASTSAGRRLEEVLRGYMGDFALWGCRQNLKQFW